MRWFTSPAVGLASGLALLDSSSVEFFFRQLRTAQYRAQFERSFDDFFHGAGLGRVVGTGEQDRLEPLPLWTTFCFGLCGHHRIADGQYRGGMDRVYFSD